MNSEQQVPVELPGFPFKVFQSKSGQTVTQDTQNLLDTILANYGDTPFKVLELGSGTGILSILMKLNRPEWHISGIEIQPHLVEISHLNAKACCTDVHFVCGDIRQLNESQYANQYDIVVSNPPYFRMGEYRLSTNPEKAISRHELCCTMDDVLAAVQKTMRSDGRAYLIYPQRRIDEIKQKIKNIDLQLNAEFSLSTLNGKIKDRTVIVELAYADHR